MIRFKINKIFVFFKDKLFNCILKICLLNIQMEVDDLKEFIIVMVLIIYRNQKI